MNELLWIGIAGLVLAGLIVAALCAVSLIARELDAFLKDADKLRLYMDETFAARFPLVWAGRRYQVTLEMGAGHD